MVQLNDSKSESTLLNQQLLQERNLTKSLNESLVKYENSVSALERECDTLRIQNQQKETEIQKLKTEKQKMVTTIVALVGSLILFLLTAVVVLVFRTKK